MNNEENKTKVRVIKYDSDSYIAKGNYDIAVFEMLKDSGIINIRKNKTSVLRRPERIIL